MPVLDLAAYKPVPATLGDANQVANGFQAIVNCINALDNNNFAAGRIFDPAKLMQNAAIDGDPMVWDNTLTKWVPASTLAAGRPRAARVFTSTLAGGPPASPVDQDIWVATAVDANGTRWGFQYNAGSGSSYKWEFIGGSDLFAIDNTGTNRQNANNSTWEFIAGMPSVTLARAGEYRWSYGARFQTTNTNDAVSVSPAKTSTPTAVHSSTAIRNAAEAGSAFVSPASMADDNKSGITRAAADVIGLSLNSNPRLNVGTTFPWLSVRPVRIA